MPYLFSCLVQLRGSALVSEVTVRSAGAEPLAMASIMRGDTKARLSAIVCVIESGLFIGLASKIIVGRPTGVEVIER